MSSRRNSPLVSKASFYKTRLQCCALPFSMVLLLLGVCYYVGAFRCRFPSDHVFFDILVATAAVVIHLLVVNGLKRLAISNEGATKI